jgi:hypothetical protein
VPLFVSSGISAGIYQSRGFKIDSIQYSQNRIVDNIRLEIDNLDSVMTGIFLTGNIQGENLILGLGLLKENESAYLLDTTGSPILSMSGQPIQEVSAMHGIATLFIGDSDAWDLDEERLKLTAVSVMNAWSQETLNLHSASCRWKAFKNVATCKYAGAETWCDRTYTRCETLGNTANYGGFRWLPSIVDKVLWWGKVPKTGEA